jgi:hypothetical protein
MINVICNYVSMNSVAFIPSLASSKTVSGFVKTASASTSTGNMFSLGTVPAGTVGLSLAALAAFSSSIGGGAIVDPTVASLTVVSVATGEAVAGFKTESSEYYCRYFW